MAEALVHRYVDDYLFGNALTLATVLYNESPTPVRLHTLATVYVRKREFKAAYELLKGSTAARNRYLRAFCCLNLNLLQEAEDALLHPAGVPNGASGYHMLGVICQRANRSDQAISYFRTSLRLDPLMFDSLKALCDLGVQDAEDLINVPPSAAAAAYATFARHNEGSSGREIK